MKLKIKHFKKIVKEQLGGTSFNIDPRTDTMPKNTNTSENVIALSIQDFASQILDGIVQQENINQESETWETEYQKAVSDFSERIATMLTSKIANVSKEIVSNLKSGKYTEADKQTNANFYKT